MTRAIDFFELHFLKRERLEFFMFVTIFSFQQFSLTPFRVNPNNELKDFKLQIGILINITSDSLKGNKDQSRDGDTIDQEAPSA